MHPVVLYAYKFSSPSLSVCMLDVHYVLRSTLYVYTLYAKCTLYTQDCSALLLYVRISVYHCNLCVSYS